MLTLLITVQRQAGTAVPCTKSGWYSCAVYNIRVPQLCRVQRRAGTAVPCMTSGWHSCEVYNAGLAQLCRVQWRELRLVDARNQLPRNSLIGCPATVPAHSCLLILFFRFRCPPRWRDQVDALDHRPDGPALCTLLDA